MAGAVVVLDRDAVHDAVPAAVAGHISRIHGLPEMATVRSKGGAVASCGPRGRSQGVDGGAGGSASPAEGRTGRAARVADNTGAWTAHRHHGAGRHRLR